MVYTRMREEIIDTDVLVVGAGAGGLMAAISAADKGVNVTLCEKGNARRSGGIYAGNDHFMCYIPEIHGPNFLEDVVNRRLNSDLIDEDILRKQFGLTYEMVKKWESWGINMKTQGHYEFAGHALPGSSGKMGEPGKTNRIWLHFSDSNSCPKLEKQARIRGVNILNRVMITELLKNNDGCVVGAIGISTREAKFFVFRTKSIVINKGGVDRDRLYPSPNMVWNGMAMPGTGDGVMAAFRIGAKVQNAEFFMRQVAQRFGPTTGKGTWVGVVRNSEGKPIAPPYLSKPNAEIGDIAIEDSDAVNHTWNIGKGPVWMDTREISEEDEKYMRWGFESEAMIPFLRWLDQEKIDIKKTRFEFTSIQPNSLIQLRVDANYLTSIQGLYSIGPGPLSFSAVGGQIAGESASKYAEGVKFTDLSEQQGKIDRLKQDYEAILNREEPEFADWKECQWAIYQVMQCYAMPPNRTESTLMAGYQQLLRIREKTRKLLRAKDPHELHHCLEVLNLLDIAELVILAVNERKESRGLARRMDYPFPNPMLKQFLVISRKEGKITFRWERPRRIAK